MIYEGLNEKQVAIMNAIEHSSKEDLVYLIKKEGVDANFVTDDFIQSPIYLAIHKDNYDLVKWLIEEGGVTVNRKTLEWAGIYGNPSICQLIFNQI